MFIRSDICIRDSDILKPKLEFTAVYSVEGWASGGGAAGAAAVGGCGCASRAAPSSFLRAAAIDHL